MADKDAEGGLGANGASALVASVCSLASVLIVLIALKSLTQISDGGMWAIAVMTLAPTGLGVGIAFFIHQTAQASRRDGQRNRPVYRDDEGYREGWPK